MYLKEYEDYPVDKPLIKEQVEAGHGIIGCEMHEMNGWGTDLHLTRHSSNGFWKRIICLFSFKSDC